MNIMNTYETVMNLQLFADVGDVVTTSDGYVNASTGDLTDFEGKYDMSPALKTFYDTELLENAKAEMIYAQFGKKQPLPAGRGNAVEWRKWNTFDKASKLEEGVIPTGQKFGISTQTGYINQYGTYAAVSDRLEMQAYDDVILGATEEMGASAAQTQETLIRDALLTNPNVMYCYDGVENAQCGDMDESCVLTPEWVAKAVTIMKKNRVPTINGKYYAVIHPSVAYDLRKSNGWLETHKYASPDQIFNGEIGELHGCRFVENVFAPVLGGDYANASGVSYATYFFGKDAFGIIDPEGGALEMIVKDKSQVGGPLNQFSTIGYKLETNGATILYPERILRVMSASSYSRTDEEN